MKRLLLGVLGAACLAAASSLAQTGHDAGGRLFYLDIARGGRVLAANDDGANVTVVSPSRATGPDGIAVDAAHGRLYWTTMGAVSANDGTIERADLDGGHPMTIVPAGGTFTPKQIKIDAAHGKLYWSDREGMRIMRANLDGTKVEALVETASGDAARRDARNWCVGIALDEARGRMYWTQKGNGGNGRILRAGLELPAGDTPAHRSDVEVLFDGLPEPIDMDLDLTARLMYWTDRGDPPRGNTVSRAPMDPPRGVKPAERRDQQILFGDLKEGIGIAIDPAHGRMFVTDLGGNIYRAKLDGSEKTTILTGQGTLTGIAYAEPTPVAAARSGETALDRYIHAPDPSYHWERAAGLKGEGYTADVLDLTSQTWTPPTAPDHTVWKHWLTVVRPDEVRQTAGFLFITGGANTDKAPEKVDAFMADLAVTTHSVVAELRMVPNQPINFPDARTRDLVEDQFIAYTWDKFLRTGDDRWPARLPMTKSAVRAMDAVQAFAGSEAGGRLRVDRFVVAGASKRGWTTWTTAAVDPRVVAIAPIVIDMLNVEPSFDHHYRAYGAYSEAVKDYQDLGIMDWTGTPPFRALMRIEEPYEYRDRLTMPKYIVNASGDQYFLPDSSQFYYGDLKGEAHLRYVPNTDHSLRNSDAREGLIGFYDAFLRGRTRPALSWAFGANGAIRVTTSETPTSVRLWQATNPDRRDFRVASIGRAYQSTTLSAQPDGSYTATVATPPRGWTAAFVELGYASGGRYPLIFTTAVRVVPDTLPFESPKRKLPTLLNPSPRGTRSR